MVNMKKYILTILLALFIGGCGKEKKHVKKPVENQPVHIAFVEQMQPAMRVVMDTFRYEFNTDSTVATKSWHRDTFYLIGRPVYDSVRKKDTVITYVIPKEFVIKERLR